MKSLTLLLLAALIEPLNPPAPELLQIVRNKTHAELTWRYGENPQATAFQVNRWSGSQTNREGVHVELKDCRISHISSDPELHFQYLDKKLLKNEPYFYTVIAFTGSGTSLESNTLEIKP